MNSSKKYEILLYEIIQVTFAKNFINLSLIFATIVHITDTNHHFLGVATIFQQIEKQ